MLAALVAKSLVRRGTEGRYDLHELVRQYAQERLAQAGELDTTCHKHMRYYLELAERLEPKLRGAEQSG
jgi:predicted ATPase